MPKLPSRMLCIASSTGGKAILKRNLLLEAFHGSYEESTHAHA